MNNTCIQTRSIFGGKHFEGSKFIFPYLCCIFTIEVIHYLNLHYAKGLSKHNNYVLLLHPLNIKGDMQLYCHKTRMMLCETRVNSELSFAYIND